MINSLSRRNRGKTLLSIFFAVVCILYVLPVVMVAINSFKVNTFVKTDTFGWPSGESFAGFDNFIKGMTFGNYPFWKSVLYSTVITLLSTALILLTPLWLRGIFPGWTASCAGSSTMFAFSLW